MRLQPLSKRRIYIDGGHLAAVPKKERGQLQRTLQVRVDVPLLQRIDIVAEETGRKRSDVMRLLMVAGLEQHERERNRKR